MQELDGPDIADLMYGEEPEPRRPRRTIDWRHVRRVAVPALVTLAVLALVAVGLRTLLTPSQTEVQERADLSSCTALTDVAFPALDALDALDDRAAQVRALLDEDLSEATTQRLRLAAASIENVAILGRSDADASAVRTAGKDARIHFEAAQDLCENLLRREGNR